MDFAPRVALPIGGRILVAGVMIFPLRFFLGMPFPLGILAIAHQPRGAIAWAWGMNGLFTVVGGLASVVMSLLMGFNFAVLVALVLYAAALGVFRRMRDTVPQAEVLPARVVVDASLSPEARRRVWGPRSKRAAERPREIVRPPRVTPLAGPPRVYSPKVFVRCTATTLPRNFPRALTQNSQRKTTT